MAKAYDYDARVAYREGYNAVVSTGNTSTDIGPVGITTIAQSTNKTYTLADAQTGDMLQVFVDTDSTGVINIQTNSSAKTFYGSTNDAIAISTGNGTVELRFSAVSTSVVGVGASAPFHDGSTGVLFTASASTRL